MTDTTQNTTHTDTATTGDNTHAGAPSAADNTAQPTSTSSLLAQSSGAAEWSPPEKYLVKNDDGSPNWEAIARKTDEARGHLEKRFGSGDLPPKSAEEYAPKVEVDGFDWDVFKADPETQSFLKGAHAKGMTNEQVGFVLSAYAKSAPKIAQAGAELNQESAAAALREVWTDEAAYKSNINGSFRAFDAFAQEAGFTLEQAEEAGLADNPLFIRYCAAVAKHLGEDMRPAEGVAMADSTSIADLMKSEAYTNSRHPDHARVSEQVRKHYEGKYKT